LTARDSESRDAVHLDVILTRARDLLTPRDRDRRYHVAGIMNVEREPYRSAPPAAPMTPASPPLREEVVLYGMLTAVGPLPVASALMAHAALSGEATVGLLMTCAGVAGLVASARAAARARRRRT
jgi:hypothetical protein